MKTGKIFTVVGGLWGSCSKGQLIEYLAKRKLMDACVRTGSINAGHVVVFEGKKYTMQSVPGGWVGGKQIKLIIGAGAYLEAALLNQEIGMIYKALTGHDMEEDSRILEAFELYIDPKAGLHTDKHQEAEVGLHQRMGSTGKGCMAAMVDKMARRNEYQNFGETQFAKRWDGIRFKLVDTCKMINDLYDEGKTVVLEGTQGAHLDLIHGDYPYVTSRPTNAAAWLAEAGVAPTVKNEVAMVVRTMPIRVAGNSGPLPQEVSWADVARQTDPERKLISEDELQEFELMEGSVLVDWQMPADIYTYNPVVRLRYAKELSALHGEVFKRLGDRKTAVLKKVFELTTVTKKMRRIGRLDMETLKKSARLNRPTFVHLSFLNYLWPEVLGLNSWEKIKAALTPEKYAGMLAFFNEVELACGCPIRYTGTSAFNVVAVPAKNKR